MPISNLSLRSLHLLKQIKNDNSGLALTEFAMILPVFIVLGLNGIEVVSLATTTMQVNSIAATTVDNASRVVERIDEADIEEIFTGTRVSGENIDFANKGRVIISNVVENGQTGTNKGYTISWQRCFGKKALSSNFGVTDLGKTNADMAAGIGPTGNKIFPDTGDALIFVEAQYDYVPLSPITFFPARVIKVTSTFSVRERVDYTVSNVTNRTVAQRRSCDKFSAT